jgi:hypothetical protein
MHDIIEVVQKNIMTIKKITKVQTTPSEEKIENIWKELKSLRIKLLQESDWVFVNDSNLTESCIASWVKWRERVKKAKNINNIDEAFEYLNALKNNKPTLQYLNEKPTTIELYKKLLTKALQDNITLMITNIGKEFGGRDMIMEKFEEAVKYNEGSSNYILLEIEAEVSGKSVAEVAEEAINNRQTYLSKLIKVERSKHLFLKHIESVETFEDCDRLLDGILKLTDKRWIST